MADRTSGYSNEFGLVVFYESLPLFRLVAIDVHLNRLGGTGKHKLLYSNIWTETKFKIRF